MIKWFAAHPTASNLLLIIIIAAGLFSMPSLKRETFPDYRPIEVGIEVVYRGASASDVEGEICARIYDSLKRIDYLDEVVCTAQDNAANATATMKPKGNLVRFISEIETEVNAITSMPKGAERPIIRQLNRSDLVAAVGITGDLPISQLEDYALSLERKIMSLPGVSNVTIRGMSQRQWLVEVPRDVLAQYDLSINKLSEILSKQSVDIPMGTLETYDRDIQLRFTEKRNSLKALSDIVVVSSAEGGGEVTLGNIATLTEIGEKPEDKILINGQRGLVLELSKSLRDDALDIMDSLTELTENERQKHSNLNYFITQDMTSIVKDRLTMLIENGVIGLILVILVMSLFFRPQLAFWAVLGLPIAFMGAFWVMSLTGLSINMITLVALLMSIGIVMDDAIVISDNIVANTDKDLTPVQVVTKGTIQVVPGVMSSFLTTVSVFLPLSFLSGELGAVLEVLPVVLIAALTASLIEAFFILPHHLKGSIKKIAEHDSSKIRRYIDEKFEVFKEHVGVLTDKAIKYRYHVVAVITVVMLSSIGYIAGGHISTESMPDMDGDTLEARILLPQGTPLVSTEQVARAIESAIWTIHNQHKSETGEELVKLTQVRFNYNPSAGEVGAHLATVMVDLLTAEKRSITLNELTERWYSNIGNIPGLLSLIIKEPGFGPAGIPIEIRLQGDDLNELKLGAEELSNHLKTYEAIYNVSDNLRPGKPQRRFEVLEGAYSFGLTTDSIASQLRSAFLGDIADTQRVGLQDVDILVRQSGSDRSSLDDITEQTILLDDGRKIPLDVLVKVTDEQSWGTITRIDDKRTVTVQAQVKSDLASAKDIISEIDQNWLSYFLKKYPTIAVSYEGEVASSNETGGSIAKGLLIGLIGIFVILSFQFRSYSESMIIMLSIPLAFIGAMWGHVAMGWYISSPSLIGAASLAGIVVNNAILLVQFINEHRFSGLPTAVAAGQASRDRLRAILISSTTTIAGLLPLLTETSTQSASLKPLTISVVFGLLSSTVLVLFIIPALYVVFDDFGWIREDDR